MNWSIVISIFSALFSSGAVAAFIRHSNSTAVQKDRQARVEAQVEKQQDEINKVITGLALTNQSVTAMAGKLGKLDLLEVVHTNVEHLKHLADNMIPRPEAEAKFEGLHQEVETLKNVVLHQNQH